MALFENRLCPFCHEHTHELRPGGDVVDIKCAVCCEYQLSGSAVAVLDNDGYAGQRWVFANASRRANDAGIHPRFDTHDLDRIARETKVPPTPLQAADDLLLGMASSTSGYGRAAVTRWSEWARYRVRDKSEFAGLHLMLVELGWTRMPPNDGGTFSSTLTVDGWKRVAELRRDTGEGRLAFVAMSFDPKLNDAFEHGIRPAIEDDCGYSALRVDRVHYNDKIDDRILADLRRARFVVADVTMHKQGVYFEAGFGLGLGRQVIYTCRRDDIGNAHFDTRQYNHILWETPEDLRESLANRIRATIGSPS